MPQNDILRRYLDAGVAFTQMTRQRAEEIVGELVHAGEVQREQTQQWVDELVERSRRNTEALVDLIRSELRQQFGDDFTRLEQRVNELTARVAQATEGPRKAAGAVRERAQKAVVARTGKAGGRAVTKKSSGAKKSGGAKSTTGKATARKTTAKKTTAKKTTAKKSGGAKSTARKATAKKTTAKKTGATKGGA